MNDLGLFTIEKRVQPALPESYIVTIKISEEPKGFFTRLYSIYQNNRIYLTKEIKKKLFKEDSIIWKASFEPSHDRKGMEISKHHEFRRIMAFNFRTEIDMIDARNSDPGSRKNKDRTSGDSGRRSAKMDYGTDPCICCNAD
ncbi:hypothetical protein BSK66_31890 [Paenibacillus odorifer]|uniref:hypothetical protein n=1 Tax=Paenibacillus TaxID=44249 RepID=UPI0003E1D4AE|nr:MULTISPECIES: hypothetical protein [Paenibacillus]ETT61040.1 hypothetical protein C171_13510 [Paenibacillus sp. FSL H8-237]OMD13713.1 hypothetical protein BJP47_24095 [Paenibacillus odorifer]OME46571.1 hypothetical protein BSK66_31890 [Paenibacillus odorifer]